MHPTILEVDAFVRSIGVNRKSPHLLLLGAGASISSSVPSAWQCTWDWKKDIFLTNNPGLEKQFSELSLPHVRVRIQAWCDAQGFPPEDSSDEYGFYIEKCLPIADDRRKFFAEYVKKARPHVGYKLLCHLAVAEVLRSVWTTNFDGLAARACSDFDLTPIEVGIAKTVCHANRVATNCFASQCTVTTVTTR